MTLISPIGPTNRSWLCSPNRSSSVIRGSPSLTAAMESIHFSLNLLFLVFFLVNVSRGNAGFCFSSSVSTTTEVGTGRFPPLTVPTALMALSLALTNSGSGNTFMESSIMLLIGREVIPASPLCPSLRDGGSGSVRCCSSSLSSADNSDRSMLTSPKHADVPQASSGSSAVTAETAPSAPVKSVRLMLPSCCCTSSCFLP
mmetsp:Transcript_28125/g.61776  ORF Transcript_28125/g.61776 Transcript_28125/m.61776 type:complete len:200 (+) Transcript_28125:5267-5866(+)